MNTDLLAWILLFLPLAAAAGIALFTHSDRKLSAGLSIAAVIGAFVLSFILFGLNHGKPSHESALTWLSLEKFQVQFGLRFDALSLLMILVVTGVAALIHIYSWGYMSGDPGFSRFFACVSLFTFAMLGIVLANNFLELFIFWELVGVASYLLIGFWYGRAAAADAGKKAFITNRLGDFGFLLGILTVWSALGSLRFADLEQKLAANPGALGGMAATAGLLIFCGAVGKSAQFPLHVWLPDAMEGPTPVSALIHAATMVAAGVYMLCRVIFLLNGTALTVISWTGGFTALLAALIAVQQDDIKRILAYSTLSQLGYMIMSVGLGGPASAMFHLITHAFFKALLFLAAGSVILTLHHEQDIWKMGGLVRRTPVTYWTFLAGTLAIAGAPFFSGFYSKDSILARAAEANVALYALGLIVALLTSFYMFRLVFVVFFGGTRTEVAEHAKESPAVMLIPLRLLAVFSLIGGYIGVENLLGQQMTFGANTTALSFGQQLFGPFAHSPGVATLGLTAAIGGIFLSWRLYRGRATDPLPKKLGRVAIWMRNRFYFDELYRATFIRAHDGLAAVAAWIDKWIIAGLAVRGTHGTTELIGRALRLVQTGNLQTYAFLFAIGVAFVLYLVLK
jgi:NADH-quinone oxidoreductase subunit L